MTDQLEIKYWSPDQAEDLSYLFKVVFNKKVTPKELIAKYDASHLNLEAVATMGYIDGQPIGFYGAVLQKFVQQENELLALQACDFITHPTHQRKGIHQQLGKRCYEKAKEQNIKFVYGFHSVQSERASVKLGWQNVNQMNVLEIDIPTSKFNRGLNKILRQSGSKFLAKLSNYKLDTAEFKNDYVSNGFLANDYTPEELNYRCFSSNGVFEIEGCTFWLKADNILHVGYFMTQDMIAFQKAIERLTPLCQSAGLHKIRFHVMEDSNQEKILSSLGETYPSWKIGVMSFDESIDFSSLRLNYADFDNF